MNEKVEKEVESLRRIQSRNRTVPIEESEALTRKLDKILEDIEAHKQMLETGKFPELAPYLPENKILRFLYVCYLLIIELPIYCINKIVAIIGWIFHVVISLLLLGFVLYFMYSLIRAFLSVI